MHQKIDQKRKAEGERYGEQIAWNLDDPSKHIRLDLHCRDDITVQSRTEHYTQNAAKNGKEDICLLYTSFQLFLKSFCSFELLSSISAAAPCDVDYHITPSTECQHLFLKFFIFLNCLYNIRIIRAISLF